MLEFDLFIFFRLTLVVFLTIYSALVLGSSIWRLVGLFSGGEPGKQMLRLYVSYHLLTIRLGPLRGELLQIVIWLFLLVSVWWLHRFV